MRKDLALIRDVPLPVVRCFRRLLAAGLRGPEGRAETSIAWVGVRVEESSASDRRDEWRVVPDVQAGAQTFAQVELTEAGAERRRVAVGQAVGEADARRDVVEVLVLQRSVRTGGASLESSLLARRT